MFQKNWKRAERNFALGNESEGLDAVLRDMGDIFVETRELITEKAEEFGIDLDDLDDAERRDPFEEAEKDPLYQAAYDFMTRARDFVKTAELIVTPAGHDFLEDITWHHTVVAAKVFRAIGSDDDPEMRFDAVNSAAVAMKSLTISIMAFDALAPLYPALEQECKRLSVKASELKQYIGARYGSGS